MRYHGICKTLPFLSRRSPHECDKYFEKERDLSSIMGTHIRDGHRVTLLEEKESYIKFIDYTLGCIVTIHEA